MTIPAAADSARAYYNENDPFAAAWLRQLIERNLIAPGDVDERDLRDVLPADLYGYTQCHFFAGIGGWSYALRLAGWPDDRPVWTGSCPCQPFSAAGKRNGYADERHLWPSWFHLIGQCCPSVIFGEQVASKDGLQWLDLVHADLEGAGYAVGAADLCAAGVGAPHIRQRLYFVAHAGSQPTRRGLCRSREGVGTTGQWTPDQFERSGVAGDGCLVGHADDPRPQGRRERGDGSDQRAAGATGVVGGDVADSDGRNASAEREQRSGEQRQQPKDGSVSFWSPCDWLPCIDGKVRPVESVPIEMVDGLSEGLGLVRLANYPDRPHEERFIYAPLIQKGKARIGRLRGYGNAIVPQVAATFVAAYLDAVMDRDCVVPSSIPRNDKF